MPSPTDTVGVFKRFEILEFAGRPFADYLAALRAAYALNRQPLDRIVALLGQPDYACETIVIEHDYVDLDYLDEFAAFYATSFKQYRPHCTRLHFFSARIPKRTTFRLDRYKSSYLGFVVIRPTDLQRVGRTLLLPPRQDMNTYFVTCTETFTAHIFGRPLPVNAMPFCQQDSNVGACAQAALWMTARYMSKRFGMTEMRPSEITRSATATIAMGRTFPADGGLNVLQMHAALRSFGVNSLSYSRSAMDHIPSRAEEEFRVNPAASPDEQRIQRHLLATIKLAEITYRYIESGLPTILCYPGHAIVAIGHTYTPLEHARVAIQRIPQFLVHDDAVGPYLSLPILPAEGGGRTFGEITDIIAVLPRDVSLTGEAAERTAVQWMNVVCDPTVGIKPAIEKARPDLIPHLDRLEYRTYLMDSMHFKQEAISSDAPAQLVQAWLRLALPRYVWVTEISCGELLNQAQAIERTCLGKILIDSTAPAYTVSLIAMHFCDLMIVRDRQGSNEMHFQYLPGTTPLRHRVRGVTI